MLRRTSIRGNTTSPSGPPPTFPSPKRPIHMNVKRSLRHFGYKLDASSGLKDGPEPRMSSSSSLESRGSSVFYSTLQLPLPTVSSNSSVPSAPLDHFIQDGGILPPPPPPGRSSDERAASSAGSNNTQTDSFSFGLDSPQNQLSNPPSITLPQSRDSMFGPSLESLLSDIENKVCVGEDQGQLRQDQVRPDQVRTNSALEEVNEHGLTNAMNPWYDPDTGTMNYEAYKEYMSEAFKQPVTIIPDYPPVLLPSHKRQSATHSTDLTPNDEVAAEPRTAPVRTGTHIFKSARTKSQNQGRAQSPTQGLNLGLNLNLNLNKHQTKNASTKRYASPPTPRLRRRPSMITRLRDLLKK